MNLLTEDSALAQAQDLANRFEAIAANLQARRDSSDAAAVLATEAGYLSARLHLLAGEVRQAKYRSVEGFAVGLFDASGRRWFFCDGASWGGLHRTPDIHRARTFPSYQDAVIWIGALDQPHGQKDGVPFDPPIKHLPGIEFHVFEVKVVIGAGVKYHSRRDLVGLGVSR